MAFNFPDPTDGTTSVVNPLTGSTYNWQDPPGKWILATVSSNGSDVIYEGDSPPDPRGDYKLWYSTDTLELYFWYEDVNGNGAWVPTSAPITMLEDLEADVQLALAKAGVAEAAANANLTTIGLLDQALSNVENSLGKVTLEEVLSNGNIADHAIELTDGTDDAIIISPEKAIVGIASDLETKNPRFRLSHIDDQGHADAHAQWEIDNKGTRNDLDLSGDIEAFHVRFDNQEKFTLDNTGNAVFAGKVEFQPGTDDNEATVFSQYLVLQDSIQILQQEIKSLGTVINKSVPHKLIKQSGDTQNQLNDGGMYFGDCPNGNLLDIPDDWSGICFIYVDTKDNNGDFADFGPDTLDPGDLIEGVSETGYFLVEVGQGGYDEGAGKKIAGIEAKLIKASGVPGPAGQDYALTAFRLTSSGGIDLPTADDRYVQMTGDTMTGNLKLDSKLDVDGKASFKDAVKILPDADSSKYSFTVYGRVDGYHDSALLLATNNDWLRNIDDCVEYFGTSESDESLVNKKYVEELIKNLTAPKPSNFSWKLILTSGDPDEGEMCTPKSTLSKGSTIKLSHTDYDGNTFYKRVNEIFHNSALITPMITIWDKTTEGYRHKYTGSVRSISADANSNFLVEIGEGVNAKNHNLGNGAQHWVTIGGFF